MSTPECDIYPTVSESVKLWSARLALSHTYDDFESTVKRIAEANSQRYTGFITRSMRGDVTSFTRTRYPRKKYGIATIEECQVGTEELAKAFGATAVEETAERGVRVVLGLIEGYDPSAPRHTLSEVEQMLPGCEATPADTFALRQDAGGIRIYGEPVAIVRAPTHMIADLYDLADTLKQERFSLENFDTQRTYVVETQYCTEPDQDI